ncbi:hypothetical protein FOZ63_016464 [Perkinsus olseni]|uniref:Uncharacterized protein n=1 Tax=Perkinsus olseni TaxID=32597 RepID=A0A7J6SIP1_PEROL|nr:hypothetical protein FOZ63_016464 [Perkinsus olseni]
MDFTPGRPDLSSLVDRSPLDSIPFDEGKGYGGSQSSTGGRLKGISLTPQDGHSEGWGRRSPLGESPSSPMSMSIVVKCRMMMEEMSIELQQMKDTKCDLERKIRATEIECANLREDYQKELNRRREMQNELQEAEIAKGDLEVKVSRFSCRRPWFDPSTGHGIYISPTGTTQAQHASIHRKLLLAESRASEAEKQCDKLRNEVDSTTARLSEATAAKSRAELQAADAEAEVHTLKTELCETGSRLVEIEEVRCKDLEDFQAQLVEAERHWREELDAKYEEIAQLTDTLSETTDALEAQRSENEVLTERSARAEDQHTRRTKEMQHHICMLEGELKSSCQSARLVAESERDNATYARNQALETEASMRREFAEKLQQQREKYKRRIRELEEELQKRKDYEARIKELLKTETSLLRRMNDAKAITSPDPPCLTASPRCHHGHRFRDCCIHQHHHGERKSLEVVEVSSPSRLAVVEECPNAAAARYLDEQMKKVERRILLGLKHRRSRSCSSRPRYESAARGSRQAS